MIKSEYNLLSWEILLRTNVLMCFEINNQLGICYEFYTLYTRKVSISIIFTILSDIDVCTKMRRALPCE